MKLSREQLNEILARPGIAKANPALGAVASKVRKCDTAATLVRYKPRQPNRKGKLALIVTIIACRNRLCDSDNSGMGGCKAIRDAIAESLGIDDGSERIRFEYAQAHTAGAEGLIVKIEWL